VTMRQERKSTVCGPRDVIRAKRRHVMRHDHALRYPWDRSAAGPANSVRGAAFLNRQLRFDGGGRGRHIDQVE